MQNYIPYFIADKFKKGQYKGSFTACTMFLDISGFTEMTERLMLEGVEGAEVLAGIINNIFKPVIEAVYLAGGFISTFAGDAFTAIFKDSGYTLNIAACAIKIREIFKISGEQESRFGVFNISVKIGLSCGSIEWGIIGPEEHKAYYFRGRAVDGCAHSEHNCQKMDIVCDREFLSITDKNKLKINYLENDYYKILSCNEPFSKIAVVIPQIEHSILKMFVPEQIIASRPVGEFRKIVAVFISYHEEEGKSELESAINTVIKQADLYKGYFEGIDFGDKGSNSLILFGIPMTYENILSRALDFALSIRESITPKFRIGIHTGTVFAGIKGSNYRACYGVLGSVVNLSARLMMKADWNQVLCSPDIADNLSSLYNFGLVDCAVLKGFSKKINLWSLESKHKSKYQLKYSGKFIGRIEESRHLESLISPVFKGRFGGVVYIDGMAGIGKSCFVSNYQKYMDNKCVFFHFHCDQIIRNAFNPFESFFRTYFEQVESDDNNQNLYRFKSIYNTITEEVRDLDIKNELIRTESFIAAIIGLEWDNSLYSQLDPKGRYENTVFAVKNFIKAHCTRIPLIIIIDDIHWIDKESVALIKTLIRNVDNFPFIILAICRPNDDGSPFKVIDDPGIRVERLELKPFNREMTADLISDRLKTQKSRIPVSTADFIFQRSGGNPFFADQITLYLTEHNILDKDFKLKGDAGAIPSGISQIIIARIDRLSDKMKNIIKTASVLGREFAIQILRKLLALTDCKDNDKEFNENLQNGCREQIWESLSELTYIFRHALIRDSVYEIQLKNTLRKLHNLAGNLIEEHYGSNPEDHYGELAEHYEKAENITKAIEYHNKAGYYSRDNYKNSEAVGHFSKILNLTHDLSIQTDACFQMAKINFNIGNWSQSKDLFQSSLDMANNLDDPLEGALIKNDYAILLIKASDFHAGEKMLEEAGQTFQQFGKTTEFLQNRRIKCLSYIFQGRYDEALQLLNNILPKVDADREPMLYASILQNIASIYGNLNKNREYISYIKKALKIATKHKFYVIMSVLYGNISQAYHNLSDLKKAHSYLQKKIDLSKKLGHKSSLGYAFQLLGRMYATEGKNNKALMYFNHQLEIALELGDIYFEGLAYTNMSIILMKIDKNDQALIYLNKAYQIFNELNHKHQLIGIVIKIASIYQSKGQFQEALNMYFDKLESIRESNDLYYLSDILFKIGSLYLDIGKLDQALHYYHIAISSCIQASDYINLTNAKISISIVYKMLYKYDMAIEQLKSTLATAEEHQFKAPNFQIYSLLADNSYFLGDFSIALKYAKKAKVIAKEDANLYYYALMLHKIGRIKAGQGFYHTALQRYNLAVKIIKDNDNRAHITQILADRSELLLNTCRFGQALKSAQHALCLASEINDPSLLKRIRLILYSCYAKRDKDYAVKNLFNLLSSVDDQEFQADCLYYLYRLTGAYRFKSRCYFLYRQLSANNPYFFYQQRMKFCYIFPAKY